eukprot:4399503-Pleurochrysis_carterae.AAC.2
MPECMCAFAYMFACVVAYAIACAVAYVMVCAIMCAIACIVAGAIACVTARAIAIAVICDKGMRSCKWKALHMEPIPPLPARLHTAKSIRKRLRQARKKDTAAAGKREESDVEDAKEAYVEPQTRWSLQSAVQLCDKVQGRMSTIPAYCQACIADGTRWPGPCELEQTKGEPEASKSETAFRQDQPPSLHACTSRSSVTFLNKSDLRREQSQRRQLRAS